MFCRRCSMCITHDDIKPIKFDDSDIEETAIKSAMNHGTPDVSGGIQIDDHLKLVYFKDKNGHTSMIMELAAYNEFIETSKKLREDAEHAESILSCKLGLYRIYWKSGGNSLASIGNSKQGNRWFAPVNWVADDGDMAGAMLKDWVDQIEKIELIEE